MTRAMRVGASEQMVRELSGVTNLVLVDPHRMNAAQSGALRAEIANSGARIRLLKNAVARQTLKQIGQEALADQVCGMNAVVWADDPIAALKVLYGFRSKNKVLEIRAGSIDGELAGPEQLEALSKLPSRQELLGIFAGTLAAPVSSFAAVLNNIAGQFVQVLDAIRRKKEESDKEESD